MPGLLATKLGRPSTPKKLVLRPHIFQMLNQGLELKRPVTLVSAPAGFGKTTCIGAWVNALVNWPVTWLSLDPSDNDPGRFFSYLITALQKVDARLGKEIEAIIRSGQLPPTESISNTLINDISELDRLFLLVLDDFHVIQDHSILEVLKQVVLSPFIPLHLVLITREDPPLPLARLRASNQLTEIRARDLRFTQHDIENFLNELMGLSLSQVDIALLEDKTEGWVVGLQLAAIAMQSLPSDPDRTNPERFIANLSGSHRYILGYLTEQVIHKQPEAIQHFLLQTSILDALNGDLCDAVTGRSDSRVLLERLLNGNLFLIPLDDEGQWYRYHHMFIDLLRTLQSQFRDENMDLLHQRASHWYAREGMTGEAIQHALAAKDFPAALGLLETHVMDMIMQGYAKTVNVWVQALPAEWRSQSPKTNLAFAWMHLLRGAYLQAIPYMQRLEELLKDPSGDERESIRSEWIVLKSLMLYMKGNLTGCMELATQALDIAPQQDSRVKSLAYYVQASIYQLLEKYPKAIEFYQKSIQYSREASNHVAEMMSIVGLAGMMSEHGQLRLAFELVSQSIRRIERTGVMHPISAGLYASLGDTYAQWYQIEKARHYFKRALRLSILGGSNTITVLCRILLSRLAFTEGDVDSAESEIQEAVDQLSLEVPEYVRNELLSQQVCIYLANNLPAAAEITLQAQGFSFGDQFTYPDRLVDQVSPRVPEEGIPSSVGLMYNSSLRILLYKARAEGDPSRLIPGLELADKMINRAIKSQYLRLAMETLLLRAQMHTLLGDQPSSQADYIKALELAEPEGIIGIFIEGGQPVANALANLAKQNQLRAVDPGYIKHILDVFSNSQLSANGKSAKDFPTGDIQAALIEPLTVRELEVLRSMAEGLKYKDIASRLFISHNTVRFHVKAIYGKLDARNRTQAIEMARRLRIL